MLVSEFLTFVSKALPDLAVGKQSYDFPISKKNHNINNHKVFSFQVDSKTDKPVLEGYNRFLKQVFKIGSTFYLLNGAGFETCLEKVIDTDIWEISPTYDWLGEIESGFDLYFYKFHGSDLKMTTFLERKEKEYSGFFMLFDIENEVYLLFNYNNIEVTTNTESDLKSYLQLLEND